MIPLVRLESACVRVGLSQLLDPTTLEIHSGQIWVFLGANGSGKTILSELVAGVRQPSSGRAAFAPDFIPERDVNILSFEEQLRLVERERHSDESWIMHGVTDEGTPVQDFVAGGHAGRGIRALMGHESGGEEVTVDELLAEFRIDHLKERGLRFLSTGEIRKAILCRALAAGPKLLVLDDPYDGLDITAQQELHETVARVSALGTTVILVLSRESEISDTVTHVAFLSDGALVFSGPWSDFAQWRGSRHARVGRDVPAPHTRQGSRVRVAAPAIPEWHDGPSLPPGPLVEMRNVSVSYGANSVLRDVTWTARRSESWHIVGPNGAGKTTLLSLITGSNPKAYGQEITLFGRRRGTGESVWEIKQHIGLVSGDFHNSYPLRTTAVDAILSGFTDSAGLYEPASGHQSEVADEWLRVLELQDRSRSRLRELSYGQQRAVLVARAMVKRPPLLIADEPCQGLDDEHSAMVLALLDRIASETATCLLYVSHNPHHLLPSTTHRLTLEPGPAGSTASVS